MFNSLDARKGNLDQARHASEDNLISRSYMNTIQRPAHLMLELLSTEDAGEYRCRVDFRKARTRNSIIFLEIISESNNNAINQGQNKTKQKTNLSRQITAWYLITYRSEELIFINIFHITRKFNFQSHPTNL